MEAKKAKLQEQFLIDASKEPSSDTSKIFNGVSIFVNGYSGIFKVVTGHLYSSEIIV
jgi:hypothetical protein